MFNAILMMRLLAVASLILLPVSAGVNLVRRQTLNPVYTGKSENGNDTCHVASAARYIRAVVTHQLSDAKAIPTTDNVTRDE